VIERKFQNLYVAEPPAEQSAFKGLITGQSRFFFFFKGQEWPAGMVQRVALVYHARKKIKKGSFVGRYVKKYRAKKVLQARLLTGHASRQIRES